LGHGQLSAHASMPTNVRPMLATIVERSGAIQCCKPKRWAWQGWIYFGSPSRWVACDSTIRASLSALMPLANCAEVCIALHARILLAGGVVCHQIAAPGRNPSDFSL
jgi:hypothetical protein